MDDDEPPLATALFLNLASITHYRLSMLVSFWNRRLMMLFLPVASLLQSYVAFWVRLLD
jgi:hypothetical protein